jgi:hypothetical protein
MPPIKKTFGNSPRFALKYFINPKPFMPSATFLLPMTLAKEPEAGNALNSIKLGPITLSNGTNEGRDSALPPGAEEVMAAYDDWMSPKPSSFSSIPPSPLVEIEKKGEGVNWEDVRIQNWNSGERQENMAYIQEAKNVKNMMGLFEVSVYLCCCARIKSLTSCIRVQGKLDHSRIRMRYRL